MSLAIGRKPQKPLPRPRVLHHPVVGSGEGYSWRHFAAYRIQGVPPFFDEKGRPIPWSGAPLEEDESEKRGALLMRLLEACVLKHDRFPLLDHFADDHAHEDVCDHGVGGVVDGCPNFRRVDGFNIFGMGQPTFHGIRGAANFVYEKINCEEIQMISVRPDPMIYIFGQSMRTGDPDNLALLPGYPAIPGWCMQRVETELVRITKTKIKANEFQLIFYDETFARIPGERENEEKHVTIDDITAVTTYAKILKEFRNEGMVLKDLRVPLVTKTPMEDDFDDLVGMIRLKSRFDAFVVTSQTGQGRCTTGMVIIALIRHVVLGKGNFAPVAPDLTPPPEPVNPVIAVILQKPTPCPSRFSFSKSVAETPAPNPFEHILVIFVNGGPGSGKRETAAILAKRFLMRHISMGDLLRDKVDYGGPLAAELDYRMSRGRLVEDERVVDILLKAMEKAVKVDGVKAFVLEGFPRTRQQGDLFEDHVQRKRVRCCVYLEMPDADRVRRLTKRADTSGRFDDDELTILDRTETFAETKDAMYEFWTYRRKLLKVPAAIDDSPDTMADNVSTGLRPYMLRNISVVFVVGGPGCGKGTQCERLRESFHLMHISSGDLLRDEVASGSELGKKLLETMTKGELVSMTIVLGMIAREMIKAVVAGFKGFLIDGYPREEAQGILFEDVIHPCTICLYFRASDETMLTRMMKRAETSGRADDNEETMRARLLTFHKHSSPVINYYKKKKKLIEIDAENPPDNVFQMTIEAMKEMLLNKVFVAFIVGGPGCGKGTQCDKLRRLYHLAHLSSGDLLRDEVAAGTKLGVELKETMERGELVAMETVLEMLKRAMIKSVLEGKTGFLIDGYPREERQGFLFEKTICPGRVCIYFNATDDTMMTRMRKRAETSNRSDDNEYTMKERLKTFHKHADPVVRYFKNAEKLIEINAEEETERVFKETIFALKNFLLKGSTIIFVKGGPKSGRTTQCAKIAGALNIAHVCIDDIIDKEIQSGTKLGKKFERKRDQNIPVSKFIILGMVKVEMTIASMGGQKGFLIDGCPVDDVQADTFNDDIWPCKWCINLKVPDKLMLERLRKTTKMFGNLEDVEASLRDTIRCAHRLSRPVLEKFRKKDRLIEIEGTGPIQEVFERAINGIKEKLLKKISVIFVIGGPGCGKGTQCERLREAFNLKHISSGDLLREEVEAQTELGKELKAIMVRGELVPMKTVLFMILKAMMEAVIFGKRGFLIDGYPREREQGVLFETEIHSCKVCLYFNATDDTMLARMRKRAETSGRDDDNEETMRARLVTFHNHSQPVIDYYKAVGKLVEVNAEQEPGVVYDQTIDGMKDLVLSGKAVIFVLGGPGSGKGTQCEKLRDFYEYDHISSGDLLRNEVASESELGKELVEIMKRGELVPMSVVLRMILNAMIKGALACTQGFLIDGYPREVEQGVRFENEIREANICVYFNVADDTMLRRMRKRGETSGRADDNEVTMRARLATFHQHSRPVVEYYRRMGKLVEVQAEDHPDNVFKQTLEMIKELVLRKSINVFVVGAPYCGKTTQCHRLARTYGMKHLSTDKLLDDEIKAETFLGNHIEAIVESGNLVPTAALLTIVENAMVRAALQGHNAFVIDGFPKEVGQGIKFEEQIRKCKLIISYFASDMTLALRQASITKENPDVVVKEEAAMNQMTSFKRNENPVLDYYRQRDALAEIDANDNEDEVFRRTALALQLTLFKSLNVIFIVGGPGCGKGTQCDKLKKALDLCHISSGDLLREEVGSGSERGQMLLEIMKRGELVPLGVVLEMIRDAMMKAVFKGIKGFLIDGYPREAEQGIRFELEVHRCQLCVCFNTSDETMLERMRKRAETSGRADDNEETMLERLKTFHKHADPVLNRYREANKLAEIHAEATPQQVFSRTMEAFKKTYLQDILIIFVVGGPGCGKGTQCDKLKAAYSLTHISSGDLLRDEVAAGTDLGKEVLEIMQRGELVPLEIVLTMIRNAMLKAVLSGTRGFLIDGYPREREQGVRFESDIHAGHACVYFNVADDVMLSRMRKRAETSGRADDNEATMAQRLKTFREHSDPVIDYFRMAGKLVEIDATANPEVVFNKTVAMLGTLEIFPSQARPMDHNLKAVDDLMNHFAEGRLGKKLLDIVIDLCGPEPLGTGVVNIRNSIMKARDRFVNQSFHHRLHWEAEGKESLRRYLYLICFSVYIREHVHTKFEVSFKQFMTKNYKCRLLIDKSVERFMFN